MVFHSVNCAEADLTCASSCINCGKSQSLVAAADCAAAIGAAASSQTLSATMSQIPARLMPVSCPEIVEIEPVEWRRAAVMLEPLHITAHRAVEPCLAVLRPGLRWLGERFEEHFIGSAATIQPNHHDDRPL